MPVEGLPQYVTPPSAKSAKQTTSEAYNPRHYRSVDKSIRILRLFAFDDLRTSDDYVGRSYWAARQMSAMLQQHKNKRIKFYDWRYRC